MATEEDASDQGNYVAERMKIAVALALFPLIPFAVAFNVLGIADQLSFLPGIGRKGGAVAGIIALVYVGAVVGIATGSGAIATGADVPIIGGGDDSIATTPTPTPEPTETPTPEPMPTPEQTQRATPTPTPELGPLERFEGDYRTWVDRSMHNESLTGVPIMATEYRQNDDGQLELWVVFWECDFAESQTDQWITVGNNFINTVGPHEGEQPDRLRIYSVSNLTHFEDEITYIPTSSAEAAYNETMSLDDYTENWWDRKREPTRAENETAYQMVVNESGREVADLAFFVDHADNDKASCNGGAAPGIGSDDREEHFNNTS